MVTSPVMSRKSIIFSGLILLQLSTIDEIWYVTTSSICQLLESLLVMTYSSIERSRDRLELAFLDRKKIKGIIDLLSFNNSVTRPSRMTDLTLEIGEGVARESWSWTFLLILCRRSAFKGILGRSFLAKLY